MNVNDISKKTLTTPADAAAVQSRSNGRAAKTGQMTETSSTDQVQLSSRYQTLGNKVTGSDGFDAAKVEQIKAAIANGEFRINPEKIADGLITSIQEFMKAKQ